MSHLDFLIFAFFTNFCPFKSDISGNTFWPEYFNMSDFQFLILAIFTNFCLQIVTFLVTMFDRKFQVLKICQKGLFLMNFSPLKKDLSGNTV